MGLHHGKVTMSTRLALSSLICALIMTGLTACGPVSSTAELNEAEGELERARIAEAHLKAPYEYYSAKEYLHKAKEEWGYSDFEASKDYASECKRNARAAQIKAKDDPYTGTPVPQDKLNKARLDRIKKRQKNKEEYIQEGDLLDEP